MFNVRTLVPVVALVLLLPALAVPGAAAGPAVKLAVHSAGAPFGGAVPSDANVLLNAVALDAQGIAVSPAPVVFWSVEGGCGVVAPVSPDAQGRSSSAVFDPTRAGTSGCRVRIATQSAIPVVPEETAGADASNPVVGWSGVVAVQAAGAVESIRVRTAAGGAGVEMGAASFTTDGTLTLYAAGYDHDFNFLRDVAATWASSDATVVTVPGAAATSAALDFKKVGSATVTATFGSLSDATGTLTVSGTGALATLKILDAATCTANELVSVALTADQTVNLHAVGSDADGNCLGAQSVAWTVTNAAGTFAPTPASSTVFTANKVGLQTLTATSGSVSKAVTANITHGALAKFKLVAPATATASTAFDVAVTAQDADGNTATAISGARSFVFSGPGNSPAGGVPTCGGVAIGATASVTFTNGAATVSCVLKKAATATVTGASGGFTGVTGNVAVAAGARNAIVACVAGLGQAFDLATGLCTGGVTTAVTPGNPGFLVDFYALDAERNLVAFTGTVQAVFGGASPAYRAPNNAPTARSGTVDVAFGTATGLAFTNGKATTTIKLYRAEATNVTVDSVTPGEIDLALPTVTVNAGPAADLGILDCSPTLGDRGCILADPTGETDGDTEAGLTLYAATFDVFGNLVKSRVPVDWVQSRPTGAPSGATSGQNKQQFFFGSVGDWKIDVSSADFPGKTASLTVHVTEA